MKSIDWLFTTIFVFAILMFIGWVMNIYDVVQMLDGDITGKFLLKFVGIFLAPLGSVLGWFL